MPVNFVGLDENLARLRNLLDITRRGMRVCMFMSGVLCVAGIISVGFIFSECLMNTCGVFPAVSMGLCLIFITINFLVCARAAAVYSRMYHSHLEQYKACEGVIEFLRSVASAK